jgi:hypothetical protein
MHGGKSTGPRTTEGVERVRAARTSHGFWSQEGRAFRRFCSDLLSDARRLMRLTADQPVPRPDDPMQSGAAGRTAGNGTTDAHG